MWDLKIIDTDKSLYLAIADAIERDIRLGLLKAGDRMPTHRALAQKVGVNVTTVTRAYQEAEKRSLITSTVGRGTFITADLGSNASLVNTGKTAGKRIEMGLALPLYAVEPDMGPLVARIQGNGSLNRFMAYTPPQGLPDHRQIGSEWVRRCGVAAEADHIVITAGAQHALNCIFSSLFQPGDRVAVDCLTYPGVKTAAKRCGIHLEGVPMDGEGMVPQELEAACRRSEIKGICAVAAMQNPTNACMSEPRRAAIAKIIRDYHLILIEDDIYNFLSPGKVSPLTQLVPDQAIYLASVAKALYAGLRICFVAAPAQFCSRIAQAVVDTIWMAPALTAEIACECIASGMADEIIALKRAEIRKRAELMAQKLSGCEYQYAENSMFVWLKLPEYWNSGIFEKMASEFGVNVYASEKFAVGSLVPPDYIRISLTGTDDRLELANGFDIILKLLEREKGSSGGVL